MTVRIEVDASLCSGQGRCYSVSPEILDYDDQGFVTINGSSLTVDDSERDLAEQAAQACPEGAITVSKDG
jgi:ferredoxin